VVRAFLQAVEVDVAEIETLGGEPGRCDLDAGQRVAALRRLDADLLSLDLEGDRVVAGMRGGAGCEQRGGGGSGIEFLRGGLPRIGDVANVLRRPVLAVCDIRHEASLPATDKCITPKIGPIAFWGVTHLTVERRCRSEAFVGTAGEGPMKRLGYLAMLM